MHDLIHAGTESGRNVTGRSYLVIFEDSENSTHRKTNVGNSRGASKKWTHGNLLFQLELT